MLRDNFFKKIINQNHVGNSSEYLPSILTIPVLAMTATFNHQLLVLVQKMIGIKILAKNIFWCHKHELQKRHINIDLIPTHHSL
mmetsp:Transcript_21066/g.29530  ORF Transcript_21066/g.29530 Transcript_21066/m.29530 type:complete len:84 (+) Transcript_21066:555-806(+)